MDTGHFCPISMTYAVIPSLRVQPELAAVWEPRALSSTYDPAFRPAEEKADAMFGMAMTEKQGGSDVRANRSSAEPIEGGGPGTAYRLTGHKWFCSAPMSDAFLVLAKVGSDAAVSGAQRRGIWEGSRARSWSATATPPWPTPSSRPGSPARVVGPSGPSRPRSTRRPSWPARCPRWPDPTGSRRSSPSPERSRPIVSHCLPTG